MTNKEAIIEMQRMKKAYCNTHKIFIISQVWFQRIHG